MKTGQQTLGGIRRAQARDRQPVSVESTKDEETARRPAKPASGLDTARFLASEVLNGIQYAPSPKTEGCDEVLLECERDGYRVILMRQHAPAPPTLKLSPREMEIARMIAKGLPNKTIAGVLEISSWTVGTHLRRIFAKFGVNSRAAMVARLINSGLLGALNRIP